MSQIGADDVDTLGRAIDTEPDLVVIQGCMASYRDGFVKEILRRRPKTSFYCGDSHFDATVVLSSFIAARSCRLQNRFLWNRRLLWQSGAVTPALQPTCVVLEFNPRILNVWVVLLLRRLLRRRTLLWGHAWPRRGPRSRSVLLRRVMVKLAGGVILYTGRDREELAAIISRPTWVAPNAVSSSSSTRLVPGKAKDVLQIGRLVEGKRPHLTLQAWIGVVDELPDDARLVFVGRGPAEPSLKRFAAESGVANSVVFRGQVDAPEELERIFADSLVSVSAGYAGLALTQSLAYGVPVIIADKEPHAPEVALASAENSRYFTAGDATDLACHLLETFADRDAWIARRTQISQRSLADYSVEAMAAGFLQAVDG